MLKAALVSARFYSVAAVVVRPLRAPRRAALIHRSAFPVANFTSPCMATRPASVPASLSEVALDVHFRSSVLRDAWAGFHSGEFFVFTPAPMAPKAKMAVPKRPAPGVKKDMPPKTRKEKDPQLLLPPQDCYSCEQTSHDMDKHSTKSPSGPFRVKFHKKEISRKDGKMYLVGHECYPCFNCRRRFFIDEKTGKAPSQVELNEARKKDPKKDADFNMFREDQVRHMKLYQHMNLLKPFFMSDLK